MLVHSSLCLCHRFPQWTSLSVDKCVSTALLLQLGLGSQPSTKSPCSICLMLGRFSQIAECTSVPSCLSWAVCIILLILMLTSECCISYMLQEIDPTDFSMISRRHMTYDLHMKPSILDKAEYLFLMYPERIQLFAVYIFCIDIVICHSNPFLATCLQAAA